MPTGLSELVRSQQLGNPQPEAKLRPKSSASLDSETSIHSLTDTSYTIFDIAKAGCLLAKPPIPTVFEDEDEMRHIYTLIYDVFRYKSVLNQALVDVSFFILYPQFQSCYNQVWLLFYDLYKQHFLPRDSSKEDQREELFTAAGISIIYNHLWQLRVRLAAAIARLRIKNNALHLTQLLPPHLRDERAFALQDSPVTGWINTFKQCENKTLELIKGFGLKPLSSKQKHLGTVNYMFDNLCPKLILFHSSQRTAMVHSLLVQDHQIILQDRAFCVGPAVMCKILAELHLKGTVAQTHVNSPRTMAYLANILADNENIERLVVFGAGERKAEYDEYLCKLGVTNTQVMAERFVDLTSDSALLTSVNAVLATPPNTYSGLADPVDLVCCRGGDLAMLEALTGTELGTGPCYRIEAVLEEQRRTLRNAMANLQIQVVLYETHSIAMEENDNMVTGLVSEANQNVFNRHIEERGKSFLSLDSDSDTLIKPKRSIDTGESSQVEIPPCELFEIGSLPDSSLTVQKEGCFLALLKRKEITGVDEKYLLAQSHRSPKTEVKKYRAHKRKKERLSSSGVCVGKKHVRHRCSKLEMNRIAAPTQSSLLRQISTTGSCEHSEDITCERHQRHTQDSSKESSISSAMSLKPGHKPPWGSNVSAGVIESKRHCCHSREVSRPRERTFTLSEQQAMVHRLTQPTQASFNHRTKARRESNQSTAETEDKHNKK